MSKKKIIIAIIAINLLAGLGFGLFTFIITSRPETFTDPKSTETLTIIAISVFALLFITVSILINALKGKILSSAFNQINKRTNLLNLIKKPKQIFTIHPEANNKDAIQTELNQFKKIEEQITIEPGLIELYAKHKDDSIHRYRAQVEGLQIKTLDRYS